MVSNSSNFKYEPSNSYLMTECEITKAPVENHIEDEDSVFNSKNNNKDYPCEPSSDMRTVFELNSDTKLNSTMHDDDSSILSVVSSFSSEPLVKKSNYSNTQEVLNSAKSDSGDGLLAQIRDYEIEDRNFIEDLSKLDEKQKNNAINEVITKFDDAVKNNNARFRVAKYLEDCLDYDSQNTKDFVEKFLNTCSSESFSEIIDNTSVGVKFLKKVPQSELNSKIDSRLKNQKFEKNKLNQKIEPTKQGGIGDCWLLSSINALSYSEEGSKILNDSIAETENGWSINFEGLGKDVEISAQELEDALDSKEYSKNDADMVLFELAFEKAHDYGKVGYGENKGAKGDESKHEKITGGRLNYFTKAFLGKKSKHGQNCMAKNPSNITAVNAAIKPFALMASAIDNVMGNSIKDAIDKISNANDSIATVSFCQTFNNGDNIITDVDGNKHTATMGGGSHAWYIKSVDKDTVTIINPWDASKEVTILKDELCSHAVDIEYFIFS